MEIIVRAAAIYFFVWIVTRSIGKRQLSELSAFQLILLVTRIVLAELDYRARLGE